MIALTGSRFSILDLDTFSVRSGVDFPYQPLTLYQIAMDSENQKVIATFSSDNTIILDLNRKDLTVLSNSNYVGASRKIREVSLKSTKPLGKISEKGLIAISVTFILVLVLTLGFKRFGRKAKAGS